MTYSNVIFVDFISDMKINLSKKNLSKLDKIKIKKHPNLFANKSFICSRFLKHKHKDFLKNSSLSHKSNAAILAFSKKVKVGVDMETLTKRNYDNIMQFCFNDLEKKLIFKANQSKKMELFYQIFTLKEAILKASNLGFHKISSVGLKELNSKIIATNDKYEKFNFVSFLYQNFVVSVAFKKFKSEL